MSFISPLRGLIGLMLSESVEPLFLDDDDEDDDPVGGYESLKGSSLLLLLPHSLSDATSGTKTSPSADIIIPPCGCGSNSGKPFLTVIVTKDVFLLTCTSVLDMLE